MHNGHDRIDERMVHPVGQDVPSPDDTAPHRWHLVPAAAAKGLTAEEARRRRAEFGPNAISEESPPRGQAFLAKFWAPIPWMLEAAVVLQVGMGSTAWPSEGEAVTGVIRRGGPL
jgi:hypothetical protein